MDENCAMDSPGWYHLQTSLYGSLRSPVLAGNGVLHVPSRPFSPAETVTYYLRDRGDEVAHDTHRKLEDRPDQLVTPNGRS